MKSAYLILGILFSPFSMWLDTVAPHGLKTSRQPFINCWYPKNPLHEQHAHDQGVILGHQLYSTYGPTADTGGLFQNAARVIYQYSNIETLLEREQMGGAYPPLPGSGPKPPTERPV
jgi:hypothetical protein